MKDKTSVQGFNRFLLQFLKDVKQWLFFMSCLALFRMAFILFFRDRIDAGDTFSDILQANLIGLRFDSMVATYCVLIPFVVVTVPSFFARNNRHAERFRFAVGALFIVLTSIVWVVSFGYFREFNDQFNHFIFNLYD